MDTNFLKAILSRCTLLLSLLALTPSFQVPAAEQPAHEAQWERAIQDKFAFVYALVPRAHRWISMLTVVALVFMGCIGMWRGWLLWAVLLMLSGMRHPAIGPGYRPLLGFGTNGERDIVTYNQHIAPKVFIPNHVTAVAVESSSLEWKVGYQKIEDAMARKEDVDDILRTRRRD